jgi:hypothetical protein
MVEGNVSTGVNCHANRHTLSELVSLIFLRRHKVMIQEVIFIYDHMM